MRAADPSPQDPNQEFEHSDGAASTWVPSLELGTRRSAWIPCVDALPVDSYLANWLSLHNHPIITLQAVRPHHVHGDVCTPALQVGVTRLCFL